MCRHSLKRWLPATPSGSLSSEHEHFSAEKVAAEPPAGLGWGDDLEGPLDWLNNALQDDDPAPDLEGALGPTAAAAATLPPAVPAAGSQLSNLLDLDFLVNGFSHEASPLPPQPSVTVAADLTQPTCAAAPAPPAAPAGPQEQRWQTLPLPFASKGGPAVTLSPAVPAPGSDAAAQQQELLLMRYFQLTQQLNKKQQAPAPTPAPQLRPVVACTTATLRVPPTLLRRAPTASGGGGGDSECGASKSLRPLPDPRTQTPGGAQQAAAGGACAMTSCPTLRPARPPPPKRAWREVAAPLPGGSPSDADEGLQAKRARLMENITSLHREAQELRLETSQLKQQMVHLQRTLYTWATQGYVTPEQALEFLVTMPKKP